jgi:ribosomal protein L29
LQKSLIHREDKKMRQLSKEEKEELLAKLKREYVE